MAARCSRALHEARLREAGATVLAPIPPLSGR